MGVYHIPHAPRRRALNPAAGQGCPGQELLTVWEGSQGRTGRGCRASDHNGDPAKPLLLRAHSLTGQTSESKEQWRPSIPHIPKDGEPPLSRCLCLSQAPDPVSRLSPERLFPLDLRRTGLTVLMRAGTAPQTDTVLGQACCQHAAAQQEHVVHSKNYFYWKKFASTKRVKNRCKIHSKKKGHDELGCSARPCAFSPPQGAVRHCLLTATDRQGLGGGHRALVSKRPTQVS